MPPMAQRKAADVIPRRPDGGDGIEVIPRPDVKAVDERGKVTRFHVTRITYTYSVLRDILRRYLCRLFRSLACSRFERSRSSSVEYLGGRPDDLGETCGSSCGVTSGTILQPSKCRIAAQSSAI